MVKVLSVPIQPFATGVTVIVDVTGAVPGLVAVNDAMSPFPFDARPVDVLLFVQV